MQKPTFQQVADPDETLLEIAEKLEEARQSGRWMAVVLQATEEPGGSFQITMHRCSWKFPGGAFPKVLELLKESLEAEQAPPDTSPLPRISLPPKDQTHEEPLIVAPNVPPAGEPPFGG